jgi:hypothetical protein
MAIIQKETWSLLTEEEYGLATARLDEMSNLGDVRGILSSVVRLPHRAFLCPHYNLDGLYRADQGRCGLNEGVKGR